MEWLSLNESHYPQNSQHPAMQRVQAFIEGHDFSLEAAGTHQVSDDFFYNIIEMETTTPDQRVWESHRDYYDIHYILSGEEKLAYNFLSDMTLGEYHAGDDYQAMDGEARTYLPLQQDQLLFFDPSDAHMTGLALNASCVLRKIVFKVKI